MQFNRIIERLARIPRAQRLMVYGGAYVLLAVIWWAALYLPSASTLSELEREREALERQRTEIDARAENFAAFEAQLKRLVRDLKQALKELPDDREIPGLLKSISTVGKKVGLEIRRFQPKPEIKREYVAEVPVAIEVVGSYHEVAMFFDRLSKMNRIVYVQDIEMGDPVERGGNVDLTVEGEAVTFRFLKDEEIQQAASEGKAKGKGRRRARRAERK